MWFCFDGFDFITHDTKESAKTAAEAALEEFREGADEGWDELSLSVCWGLVMEHVEVTSERPVKDKDYDIEQERKLVFLNHACATCGGQPPAGANMCNQPLTRKG